MEAGSKYRLETSLFFLIPEVKLVCSLVLCLCLPIVFVNGNIMDYTISSPVLTMATFTVLWKGMKQEMTAIASEAISI